VELSWEEARCLIEETDADGVAYDISGNRNHMRRFVVLVESRAGEFLYLLCLVEPALRMEDEPEHVDRLVGLLLKYREELLGGL
jgi:DNA-binding IclR family transcriptional regulator